MLYSNFSPTSFLIFDRFIDDRCTSLSRYQCPQPINLTINFTVHKELKSKKLLGVISDKLLTCGVQKPVSIHGHVPVMNYTRRRQINGATFPQLKIGNSLIIDQICTVQGLTQWMGWFTVIRLCKVIWCDCGGGWIGDQVREGVRFLNRKVEIA